MEDQGFEIVILHPDEPGRPGHVPRPGFLARLRFLFGSLLLAAVGVGTLAVILILGSLMAAILFAASAIVVASLFLRRLIAPRSRT
jgi:membrane protein implicated in regulation of membrane protease activity